MKKINLVKTFLILGMLVFVVGVVLGQSVRKIAVEGQVVAFKKSSRCPACQGADGGIGTAVENWIVRIDKSSEEKFKGNKFVLVKYQMYDRSLSVSDITEIGVRHAMMRFLHDMFPLLFVLLRQSLYRCDSLAEPRRAFGWRFIDRSRRTSIAQ